MVVEPITHIRRDDRGVAWIADSNIKVIEVAMDHVAYGWDAEEIHAAHPHLSLAQIHAALSHYHDHKSELDAEMKRQLDNYHRMRAEAVGFVNEEVLQTSDIVAFLVGTNPFLCCGGSGVADVILALLDGIAAELVERQIRRMGGMKWSFSKNVDRVTS